MRRNPTGDAEDDRRKVLAFQSRNRPVRRLICAVINDDARVNQLGVQHRKRLQCRVVLDLQPLKGRIHLTETHETHRIAHHSFLPPITRQPKNPAARIILCYLNLGLSALKGQYPGLHFP